MAPYTAHLLVVVVREIDSEIERIRLDGGEVSRFSIVGYSLGGLVARYTLGILHSRQPSFFKEISPVNFATFASPAIGIPKYDTFWSIAIRWLGGRLLSRSGAQLYENDRFLPSSLAQGKSPQKKPKGMFSGMSFARETAEPLLLVLSDPRYNFYKSLAMFEKVEIYANAVNDRTVPYPTGAIEAHDPFALARARAKKSANARGEDPDIEPDIREGGLEITLDPAGGPLISSYTQILPLIPPSPPVTSKSKPRRGFKLPLLLRPTTYPFSRPVSLLIIFTLPLSLPLSVVYLIGRFLLQGRESKIRIKNIRTDFGGGREGMLERVGVRIQEAMEEVVEAVNPDGHPELALGGEGNGHASSSSPSGSEEERAPILLHPSFAAFASYQDGVETPPMTRPVSPKLRVDQEATGEEGNPYPTDPILTEAQKMMIKNLNSIPQMKKHLTYLPEARNSHGVIVARDPNFPAHREGRKVVDAWSKDFVL